MITPINGHVLIEPLVHQTYLPTEKGTFEEVGTVIETAEGIIGIEKGTKVFFDSWLSSKYPTGKDDEFFYLVPFKDIRAIEKKDAV